MATSHIRGLRVLTTSLMMFAILAPVEAGAIVTAPTPADTVERSPDARTDTPPDQSQPEFSKQALPAPASRPQVDLLAAAPQVVLVASEAGQEATSLLEYGDEDSSVAEVQQRLQDLRYWVGPVDGVFGWLTEQAVYAFQKANGIAVDGVVGPQTRRSLSDPVAPDPRSSQGRVTEVDKANQLLNTVLDGRLEWVFHTSTGTELPYEHPAGYTALADTPPGTHTVFWQNDGWEEGALGPLYRAKYFHEDGIAVHGYDEIPPYPVSHGCVRVTFAAIDYIWANDLMPMDSTVLVYGESPPV